MSEVVDVVADSSVSGSQFASYVGEWSQSDCLNDLSEKSEIDIPDVALFCEAPFRSPQKVQCDILSHSPLKDDGSLSQCRC